LVNHINLELTFGFLLYSKPLVENEDHCDFKKLRQLLIRSHMLDLISSTEESHYESYRNAQMQTRKIGEPKYVGSTSRYRDTIDLASHNSGD
jgi:septin family protein